MSSLFWFRQDLRLSDNPALTAAVKAGAPVLCVYIHDDVNAGANADGAASKVWLHHALADLERNLTAKGLSLHLAAGDSRLVIPSLCKAYGLSDVYINNHYEPWRAETDSAISVSLRAQGTGWHSYKANMLVEPDELRTKTGGNFRVFTPFYKELLARGLDLPVAQDLPPHVQSLPLQNSLTVAELALLPRGEPDWYSGLMSGWQVGKDGAHAMLRHFFDKKAAHYKEKRDFPDDDITSRLSPYLHFGHISPAQIWRACQNNGSAYLESFTRQLVWREFSIQLLHHYPDLDTQPLQPQFARFPWQKNDHFLEAWKRGQTGYPMVDAGMRQLWATGWMHNRVRMIVASFLVKHLLQPWQDGEAWFWDTLVDADLANNSASWQWVAGCGADAAPYFRIFNPIIQGEKFDPNGCYVRQWCPELAEMPDKYIHKPWEAPMLARHYPPPLVEHVQARQDALAAYEVVKKAV